MSQTNQVDAKPVNQLPHVKLQATFNPLAAYAELPRGVKFQDQESDEVVEILLRRHPITNLKWLIPLGLLAIFPLIFSVIPLEPFGLSGLYQIPTTIRIVITLFWYVVVAGLVLEQFIVWYFNTYLVTNKRIIDVDFHGIMRYTSSEIPMHQIQDVRHSQAGVWQMLFKYGSVHIQSSGSDQHTEFEKVPVPARVADIVTDLLPTPTDVEWGKVTDPATTSTKGAS